MEKWRSGEEERKGTRKSIKVVNNFFFFFFLLTRKKDLVFLSNNAVLKPKNKK